MLEVKLLAPPQLLRRTGNKYLYHPKPIARGDTTGVERSGLGWVQATNGMSKSKRQRSGVYTAPDAGDEHPVRPLRLTKGITMGHDILVRQKTANKTSCPGYSVGKAHQRDM